MQISDKTYAWACLIGGAYLVSTDLHIMGPDPQLTGNYIVDNRGIIGSGLFLSSLTYLIIRRKNKNINQSLIMAGTLGIGSLVLLLNTNTVLQIDNKLFPPKVAKSPTAVIPNNSSTTAITNNPSTIMPINSQKIQSL